MSAIPGLTAELRKEVLALEDDLRGRVGSLQEVAAQWRSEYDAARAAERTAASWEEWRGERVTLAAVAWVLTTVFVRFCEDNGLVKPVWITHAGGRGREATDAQAHFLRETARTNPDVTDREWLLEAVNHLKSLPATAGLVDETSPMWLVSPSGDAATRILNFWRERDEDGRLVRDLTDSDLDTRFLGDLYQDISEAARKRYALLQTPVFVEEFILDRALEPALAERPLEGFKAIDPTCGSGHFLLGIFARLLDRWHAHAPGMDERERVQAALDAVHGVDLNPYAVAVARFRLTVAALQACGMTRLEDAPAFKYHLAAGDSLLHGLDQEELDLGSEMSTDRVAANFAYATENLTELKRILRNGQYDCVVGNPPYITVKDKSLNALYRRLYSTCHRKYALSVPFAERFFALASGGGWVGQITANSFLKREFGKLLIEKFLPGKALELVVDTSGAFIPGHGTPTVIFVGRNHVPTKQGVRAVLGVRGEPSKPADPAKGHVWSEIVEHVDRSAYSGTWVTVTDLDRGLLARHPWSLSGGGAVELAAEIDRSRGAVKLRSLGRTGQVAISGEDEVLLRPWSAKPGRPPALRIYVHGEVVRDWIPRYTKGAYYGVSAEQAQQLFWPWKKLLEAAVFFGKTRSERDLDWYDFIYSQPELVKSDVVIAWPEVATHNHFVLAPENCLLDKTAPVLVPAKTDADYIAELLAVLNSSVVGFWMRSKCHNKGAGSHGEGIADEPWEWRFQFNIGNVEELPIPMGVSRVADSRLLDLVAEVAATTPSALIRSEAVPNRDALDRARAVHEAARARLVFLQEEFDWDAYRLYGLIDEDETWGGSTGPSRAEPIELQPGERAFEIILAHRIGRGEEESAWFDRHGWTPIAEVPSHWPADYRRLVERRIEIIESHPYISLLEKPEHKRRWASESWEKQEQRALRGWLLDRLEDPQHWIAARGRPTPKSVAMLADEVSRDRELVDVLALWEGRPDVPVVESLTKLLAKEGVPYLAAYRYKESGLRKRAAWEHTWDLQRREDAGTYDPSPKDRGGDGPIPVPPKYVTGDFARVEYWSHRGKLDVPKERFILYPDAGRATDPTPVLGWAGWDHAQQALALAMLIQDRQDLDGWTDEQLVPLVAGLAEILPWVQQWHSEPSDLYGGVSPAEFFGQQLEERMAQVSATRDTLQAWRPAPATRGRKKKA